MISLYCLAIQTMRVAWSFLASLFPKRSQAQKAKSNAVQMKRCFIEFVKLGFLTIRLEITIPRLL
jgi:hypothetical protein